MKKTLFLLQIILLTAALCAQEILSIGGKEKIILDPIKKKELFSFEQIGTKTGFQLHLFASKENSKRLIARIANYSGFCKFCNNGKFNISAVLKHLKFI